MQVYNQEVTMLLVDHFSVKTDFFQTWTLPSLFHLFNFIFSKFSYVFIEDWQRYKEKIFFADSEIVTIVSDNFEHVLNKFSKHMKAAIVAETQICWQRKKQSLVILCKKGILKIIRQISENAAKQSNTYNNAKKHISKKLIKKQQIKH